MNLFRRITNRRIVSVLLILIAIQLSLSGCAIPSIFASPLEFSSEHFRFVADTSTSSEEEIREGIRKGEALYDAMAAFIPDSIPLNPVIEVRLNGNLRNQTPYMDEQGTLQLYRYSDEEGGYWALFAHELVHAIALDYQAGLGTFEWESLWFYFEGWAEYLAQVVDPEKSGFPFYGFEETVVVGQFVSQYGLTLNRLRLNHEELNFGCQFQSYTMRASWFRFIEETFGREAAIDIAYSTQEMTPDYIQSVLGEPLSVVDANWRDWVLAGYADFPLADYEADLYRQRIGDYQACQ
jgi:hypothetical protein